MNEHPLTHILNQLAAEGAPTDLDLRTAVHHRLETSKTHSLKGVFSMKNSFTHPRRLAATIAIVILLLAAALLLTPQGRAWAQNALNFFSRTEITLPAPTEQPLVWVDTTPGVPAPTITPWPAQAAFAADCGDYGSPRCSVEQIRSRVDFTVKELASIPPGMYFAGATGGPEDVTIAYFSPDQSGLLLLLEAPWTGSAEQLQGSVAPEAVVETVQIGDLTGEYVMGSFGYSAGETEMTWDNSVGETLRWVDGNVDCSLFASGTPLGKDYMVALAESLTTEPVSANLPPMPPTSTPEVFDFRTTFPLTVPQAEMQAGFDILEPGRLPAFLILVGASYDQEHSLVTILYSVDQNRFGPNTDSLGLSEQRAPNGADCDLCGFAIGDLAAAEAAYPLKVVGANATIETVQIGDGTGEYVEGGWIARDDTGMKWISDPYSKTLRWRIGDIAFQINFFGMEFEKADLIAIAESMK